MMVGYVNNNVIFLAVYMYYVLINQLARLSYPFMFEQANKQLCNINVLSFNSVRPCRVGLDFQVI
jgi:hypothetical protein